MARRLRGIIDVPARSVRGQSIAVKVRREVVEIDVDGTELVRTAAEAVAAQVRRDFARSSGTVAEGTIKKRRSAVNNPGSQWVRERYPQGAPSGVSRKRYVDSGLLRDSIAVAVASGGNLFAAVKVHEARLSGRTFTGPQFREFLRTLQRDIPAFAGKFRGGDVATPIGNKLAEGIRKKVTRG